MKECRFLIRAACVSAMLFLLLVESRDKGYANVTSICELAPEVGDCKAHFERWHYNSTAADCQQFIYGGCNGNENNFEDKQQCLQTCSSAGNNLCDLDPESGPCEAYILSHFYNSTAGECQQFIYGGCGGNLNRFRTKHECAKRCHKQKKSP